MIHLWGAPLALAAAALAGAQVPVLVAALALWGLALVIPRFGLLLLGIAPLALALGLEVPRDFRDGLATLASVVFSLAPLVHYLGGAPTWRQAGVAATIAGAVVVAGLTPWGRTLAASDLAPGALTLALTAASLVVFAAYLPPTKVPRR